MLALEPLIVPVLLLVFAGVVALSRFVSLGSLASAFVLPLLLLAVNALMHPVPLAVMALGFLMAVFVFLKHRDNIGRLLQGTENKIAEKKTSAP
jgi:glycerol-3-phosphate acyltransferase PlsY